MSALRDAIAGDQAALYAYGLAGPRLEGADRDRAMGGLAAHRARLLLLRGMAADTDEPGTPGGYDVAALTSPEEARALLAQVEASLAAVYADLAAATTGEQRTESVLAACECEARAIGWGGAPEAFPGR